MLPIILLAFLVGQTGYAQEEISGVVNQYGSIRKICNLNSANRDSVVVLGAGSIWDGSSEYEIALFIQMKGTGIYDPSNTSFQPLWGTEYAIFNTGIYSFMLVERIVNDSIVIFSSTLRNDDMVETPDSVTVTAQLVKVPYGNSFSLTGDLRAQPWNPATGTGGVLALFASDKLDLSGHNIDVTGQGFHGGDTLRNDLAPVLCASPAKDSTFYLDSAEHLAGRRGESTVFSGYRFSRGNGYAAGGGGGSQGRYSGGAGGSNYGKGARGGREANDQCGPILRNYGGWGGPLNNGFYSNLENRVFLGSGGGSSLPEPGLSTTPGGDGGGIVIIITDTLAGSPEGDTIYSAGQSITDTSYTGGSGGGAGGFILIDLNQVEGSVHLDVSGGKGGDTYDPAQLHGPGGGGGGGLIWHSGSDLLPGLTENKSAGSAGEHLPVGDPNFAGSGSAATTLPGLVLPLRGFSFNFISGDQDVCQDTIPAKIIGSQPKGDTGFVYVWQDSTSGVAWQDIPGASGDNGTYKDHSPDTLTVTTWFRRIVTKKTPPIESDTSGLVVKTVYNRLTNNLIADGDTVCYNLIPSAMLHVGGTITGGDELEYFYSWQAWQASAPGWINAGSLPNSGPNNQEDYTPGNLLETTYFRRQVTSHVCTHISDSLTVTVLPDITGNLITGDDRVCQFTAPSGSIVGPEPGGGDTEYEYLWQDSTSTGTWQDIATAVNQNYFPGNMNTVTTHYRRKVFSGKNQTCKSISDTVTILVDPIIQDNSIAPDTAICAETPTNTIYPDAQIFGGDGNYLYTYDGSIDSSAWTVARAADADGSYNPEELPETTWFRRRVESGACLDTSPAVRFYVDTVIINNLLLSTDDTICEGTSFTAISGSVADGGDWSSWTYIWDESNDQLNWTAGIHNGQDLPPKVLNDSTWFRRRVLSGVCFDTSALVAVNVHATVTGNEIWADSIRDKDACTMLSKLLGGQDEMDGLEGGTGNPADYKYLWKKYDPLSSLWIDAPAGGPLSNDQNNYETEILSDTLYAYRRFVSSGKCSSISDSLTLIIKPRPVGSITANTTPDETCYTGTDIRIIVPIEFSVGLKPFTVYYNDGQGSTGVESLDTYNGDFSVYRASTDSTWYTVQIDSIIDEYGCRAIMPGGGQGSKQTIIYRDALPEIVQDTFSVCGGVVDISVVAGLGSLKYWEPDSVDYSITPGDQASATFTLSAWNNDTLFYPLTWSQQNGVCPLNSKTIVVELYQEPVGATVHPEDTIIYFRQIMPMWADSATIGLGTWKDWDWSLSGPAPITDIHSSSAMADLGGSDMRTPVTRTLFWEVRNGECPNTEVEVTIERHDLVLYSAFSPNDDPYNEYLILDGLEFAEKFTMQIFSRHGVLIKTVTEADLMEDTFGEKNLVWDGRMEDDSEAEDGTYFYLIEVIHGGQKYNYKNYLELIRYDPTQ
ncbi:gliding motility-associated C-terminal domain-containing protein [Bacteroidota bacterium]